MANKFQQQMRCIQVLEQMFCISNIRFGNCKLQIYTAIIIIIIIIIIISWIKYFYFYNIKAQLKKYLNNVNFVWKAFIVISQESLNVILL